MYTTTQKKQHFTLSNDSGSDERASKLDTLLKAVLIKQNARDNMLAMFSSYRVDLHIFRDET